MAVPLTHNSRKLAKAGRAGAARRGVGHSRHIDRGVLDGVSSRPILMSQLPIEGGTSVSAEAWSFAPVRVRRRLMQVCMFYSCIECIGSTLSIFYPIDLKAVLLEQIQ